MSIEQSRWYGLSNVFIWYDGRNNTFYKPNTQNMFILCPVGEYEYVFVFVIIHCSITCRRFIYIIVT